MFYRNSSRCWDVPGGADALHIASFFGLKDVVVSLLADGVNPNTRDTLNTPALIYACAKGHTDVVNTLLDAGAHTHYIDGRGSTALLRAVENRSVILTKSVLRGKDLAINAMYQSHTALGLASELGDAEIVELLLSRPDVDVNLGKLFGGVQQTPLHLAVLRGDKKCVEAMLCHPDVDKNSIGNVARTALYYAGERGHTDILKLLLDNGADPNIHDSRPVHRAIDLGLYSVLKILLNHPVELDFRDGFGRTALHAAVVSGRPETLQLVLENCQAIDMDAQGNNGDTSLHDAARIGNHRMVELLLEHGARTNIKNKGGRTPVRRAKEAGQRHLLNILQQARTRESELDKEDSTLVLRKADSFGTETEQPLPYVVQRGDIQTLRRRLAQTTDAEVNEKGFDFRSLTPLHYACHSNDVEKVILVLEAGAFVDPVDVFGRTPLILACQMGTLDIVQSLVKSGANVNIKHGAGRAAWENAIQAGDRRAAIFLLGLPQTEISRSSNFLSMALGYAAGLGNLAACKRLLEAGAPLHQKDQSGVTPLQRAADAGHKEVEKLLFERGCETTDGY